MDEPRLPNGERFLWNAPGRFDRRGWREWRVVNRKYDRRRGVPTPARTRVVCAIAVAMVLAIPLLYAFLSGGSSAGTTVP